MDGLIGILQLQLKIGIWWDSIGTRRKDLLEKKGFVGEERGSIDDDDDRMPAGS
jgi:hypothetical protein